MFEMRTIRWTSALTAALLSTLVVMAATAVQPELPHELPTPPAA